MADNQVVIPVLGSAALTSNEYCQTSFQRIGLADPKVQTQVRQQAGCANKSAGLVSDVSSKGIVGL